jgi:hypothetical protein
MISSTEPLCRRCDHPESEHKRTLFGVECQGRFWADDANFQCGCTQFISEDKYEHNRNSQAISA